MKPTKPRKRRFEVHDPKFSSDGSDMECDKDIPRKSSVRVPTFVDSDEESNACKFVKDFYTLSFYTHHSCFIYTHKTEQELIGFSLANSFPFLVIAQLSERLPKVERRIISFLPQDSGMVINLS